MDPTMFLTGRTRETAIERDAKGQWFHEGAPLTHPNLVRSFNAWLSRAEDGRYCLSNDINWAYIALSGPPHFVRSVRIDGFGAEDSDAPGKRAQVWLTLSSGRSEWLRPETLRQGRDGALYCDVGPEPLTARLDNAAAAGLASLLGEDDQGVYIQVSGQRWYPPVTDNPIR